MNITVLGAGLVGGAIARDLALESTFSVRSVDRSARSLDRLRRSERIETMEMDLSRSDSIAEAVNDADLVVSAVPGFMGYRTLDALIRGKKTIVDISFFPEEALELDELARSNGVTAVVDCGVAPGLCNMMAGYVESVLDETHRYTCFVGGLPTTRVKPWEYKAVFSPADVLEEYTRPARFVENGELVIRPALSEIEMLDFPAIGTLEAFNTDGLRSLLRTMRIPFMKEKTLRYPGYARLMQTIRDSGFLGSEPLTIGAQQIRPIDLTSQLLFDEWRLGEEEQDVTVMRVVLEGDLNGKGLSYAYDLIDYRDPDSGIHSMARTTGYTASIVARLILDGKYSVPGICPPEYLGRVPGFFQAFLSAYAERNIIVRESVTGG